MSSTLDELVDLLSLERIEENLFRGRSQDLGWGQVFGGQVLGQALSAAAQTVPEDRAVHSLHGYFLRTGDVAKPIVYEVDRIRDGHSFTTRRVVAIQSGRPIFNMSSSFQVDEPGYDHHDGMPTDDGPDKLRTERELSAEIFHLLPPKIQQRTNTDWPVEVRPAADYHPLKTDARPPDRRVWYRALHKLPDNPALHRYLLAWASDSHFLTTSLQPHGKSWLTPGIQVASLDHAMWFHRSFRMDDWLLYVVHSPSASGARGLVQGSWFDRQGRLVASTCQEGLIRDYNHPDRKSSPAE